MYNEINNNSGEVVYKPKLAFKGDRNYISGADIAQSLINCLGPVKNITIQFHQMAAHPILGRYSTNFDITQIRSKQQLVAVMSFKDINKKQKLIALTEEKNKNISERYPYNESLVTEDAHIFGKRIDQSKAKFGSFFERAVALNKILLNKIAGKEKWVFSRIDLNYAPLNAIGISLLLKQEIGGHTYKSIISGDGHELGSIYFTRHHR